MKDWLERYLKDQQQSSDTDIENNSAYRSISSLIHEILYRIMDLFERGKSLRDLQNQPDAETLDFYNNNTFIAVTPFYDEAVKYHKYQFEDLEKLFSVFLRYREFLVKNIEGKDLYTLADFLVNRFGLFMKNNSTADLLNAQVVNDTIELEYRGPYENIQFEQSKAIIVIASIFGFELRDSLYNKPYTKFYFEPTDLFYKDHVNSRELKELVYKSVGRFINDYMMIRDETPHIWIKYSKQQDAIISFKDRETGMESIETLIQNIRKHSPPTQLKLDILTVFEHYHWIRIEDRQELTFNYEISEEKQLERELFQSITEQYGMIVKKKRGFYYQ